MHHTRIVQNCKAMQSGHIEKAIITSYGRLNIYSVFTYVQVTLSFKFFSFSFCDKHLYEIYARMYCLLQKGTWG